MRALIIGKYPPIEGGVSSHTYWLARGLGEKGVKVTVVTNANRVEEAYRQKIPHVHHHHHQVSDYEPKNVTVFSLQKPSPPHIPYSESYVTRLVNLGLKAIGSQGADVIYTHYLEPYAVAGLLLKQLTGLPLIVRHAGSDIYRILDNEDYSYVLARVLMNADAVIMSNRLKELPATLGISHKVHGIPRKTLPAEFSPHGELFDFPAEWEKPKNTPLITYLGKAGVHKGIPELLDAAEGIEDDFRLLFVSKGDLLEKMKQKVNTSDRLQNKVWFSDFVPPWTVPSILRSSDLLVHLENKFPVPIHTPGQPFEAITCGTPLFLSGEMFEKIASVFPETKDRFSVVPEPTDVDSLRKELTKAIQGAKSTLPAAAEEIRQEFLLRNDWDSHLEWHHTLFSKVTRNSLTRFLSFRR